MFYLVLREGSTDVLMQEVLVPEASEFDEWEPEGTALEGPVTAVIPTWQVLTTLDLSHNSISEIDESVVCACSNLPRLSDLPGPRNSCYILFFLKAHSSQKKSIECSTYYV